MEWLVVLALAVAILVMLFPAAFVWFICIGGIYAAIRGEKAARSALICSIDTDCPPGHLCVNGHCVPQKA